MRTFRHWTPRYVADRFGVMWDERAHPDWPWLTRQMIGILESWLRPTDVGLEFGSGRSTAWFAQRVGRLTSVEHNPDWHQKVQIRLRDLGDGIAGKVDYHLCEDGSAETADCRYVAIAHQIPDTSLDFCLIDGMARDHCALASLDKLKPGGILIVDNVNWYVPREPKSRAPTSRGSKDGYASETWSQVGRRLESWRCIWTTNGIWDSAFWVKPERQ